MTHFEKHGFKKLPICNKHVHPTVKICLSDSEEAILRQMDYFGFEKVAFMSLTRDSKKNVDVANNLKSIYLKEKLSETHPSHMFAYGNIFHYYDQRDTGEGYLNQVKEMYDMGVDGYKFLDGKPELRKYLQKRLDDPIFDKMYDFIEEKGMPVTYHLGDPPENWQRDKISESAFNRGWFWGDGTYPSLEELRDEIDGILTKHPKLKLCLAHFYFTSHHIEYAKAFMEKWENVSFDVTPGQEMFAGFSKNIEEWRKFFKKYSSRIYFGTDSYNRVRGDDEDLEFREGYPIILIRKSFESKEAFEDRRLGIVNPLNLDKEDYMNIYHNNFSKLHPAPRKTNFSLCIKKANECIEIIDKELIDFGEEFDKELETKNLNTMIEYFKLKQ